MSDAPFSESTRRVSVAERLSWTLQAMMVSSVVQDGRRRSVSVLQVNCEWAALGLVSPEITGDAPVEERLQTVFASHGHRFIASGPSLPDVLRQAENWILSEATVEEPCSCEEAP